MHRLYRVLHEGTPRHVVEGGGRWRPVEGDLFGDLRPGREIDGSRVVPLAPVEPSKIVAVGLDSKDHAAEMRTALPPEPMQFFKPPSAVVGPGEAIRIPSGIGRLDSEAERGVVIGKRARRVSAGRTRDHIRGYACFNDVTARAMQARETQDTRAKEFRYLRAARPRALPSGSTAMPLRSRDGSMASAGRPRPLASSFLSGGGNRGVRLVRHDPGARGRQCHGNPGGSRAARARRSGDCQDRGDWRADPSGRARRCITKSRAPDGMACRIRDGARRVMARRDP